VRSSCRHREALKLNLTSGAVADAIGRSAPALFGAQLGQGFTRNDGRELEILALAVVQPGLVAKLVLVLEIARSSTVSAACQIGIAKCRPLQVRCEGLIAITRDIVPPKAA
jgi:hypothetical protein